MESVPDEKLPTKQVGNTISDLGERSPFGYSADGTGILPVPPFMYDPVNGSKDNVLSAKGGLRGGPLGPARRPPAG